LVKKYYWEFHSKVEKYFGFDRKELEEFYKDYNFDQYFTMVEEYSIIDS